MRLKTIRQMRADGKIDDAEMQRLIDQRAAHRAKNKEIRYLKAAAQRAQEAERLMEEKLAASLDSRIVPQPRNDYPLPQPQTPPIVSNPPDTSDPVEPAASNESEEELEQIIRACAHSTRNAAHIFLPHAFTRVNSAIHDPLYRVIDGPAHFVAITGYRGCGKSSIMTAYMLRSILYGIHEHIVYASISETKAMTYTEQLKTQIEYNPDIRAMFGNLKSADNWSKESWITSTGVKVHALGARGPVYGLIHNFKRPSLFIIDDVEDEISVLSDEQRKKTSDWLYGAVRGCMDYENPNHKIILIGNILHYDSLVANAVASDFWSSVTIPLCDGNFKSLWPEHHDDDWVANEVNTMRSAGKMDVFYKQYMCLPVAEERALFRKFQYYTETELELNRNTNLTSFVVVDPAKVVTERSCETAIVGLSIDRAKGYIYVRDVVHGHFMPDQQIGEAIEMCMRLKTPNLGIEKTGLDLHVLQPLRNEITRRGLPINVIPLSAKGKKEDRVGAMAAYYRMGQVLHNKACCGELESQLMAYPVSPKWDIMDALSYFILMMDEGDQYFEATDEELEREAQSLELEYAGMAPLGDDWRLI